MRIKIFGVTLRDESWDYITNSEGILNYYNIKLSLEEAQELIASSVKVEKSRFGYEVYSDVKNGNISVYFRFGNVSVKKNDTIENFIKKNWDKKLTM